VFPRFVEASESFQKPKDSFNNDPLSTEEPVEVLLFFRELSFVRRDDLKASLISLVSKDLFIIVEFLKKSTLVINSEIMIRARMSTSYPTNFAIKDVDSHFIF